MPAAAVIPAPIAYIKVVVVEELVVVTLDYHLVVGVASVVLTLGVWYPHFDVWVRVSLT